MGNTTLSRRGFMGNAARACTAAGLAAGAGAGIVIADPLLELIYEARRKEAFFNANTIGDDEHDDALAAATYEPLWGRLREAPPMPTTNIGATEAVRYAMKEYRQGGNPTAVLKQALRFIEAA